MTTYINEKKRINELLNDGLTNNKQDIRLLVKHYKNEGMSKMETIKLIKKMLEEGCADYNKWTDYRKVDQIANKTWKEEIELKEITSIEMPREVINWFLALENNKLTDDQVQILLDKNRFKTMKSMKVWNFNTAKCLFTMYVWYLVQKNYAQNPNMMSIEKIQSKFKKAANLPANYSYTKYQDCLYDLGYIYITSYRSIDILFIQNEVFNTPITDNNRVTLTEDEIDNCGIWLEKQRNGSFVCACCGKEFPKYINKGSARKYCKECSDRINNNRTRSIIKICIDCGKEFESTTKSKSCRCLDCQHKKNNENKKRYKMKKKAELSNN